MRGKIKKTMSANHARCAGVQGGMQGDIGGTQIIHNSLGVLLSLFYNMLNIAS